MTFSNSNPTPAGSPPTPSSQPPATLHPPMGLLDNLRADIPAGIVVTLVALPLCLGIAQASGAPLLSGLIAGIVGGVVVGSLSRSSLSVSGPAAGLAVIVAGSIADLGMPAFLLAVVLAGVFQAVLGGLRLGVIAHYFPNAVIKGMLASIGVMIVLKQLPHAIGYDADYEGDESFVEPDGHTTFSALADAFDAMTPAAIVVSALCFGIYGLWPKLQRGLLAQVPTPLAAVVVGGAATVLLPYAWPAGVLSADHLVALPAIASFSDISGMLTMPDWSQIGHSGVWITAATLAIVASLESLLSLEAVDRLDPLRRISPPNRELVAQGVGNVVSGLIGGIPVTSVIVRSSANVQAGARSKLSAIVHGLLLALSVLFGAPLLNNVPLASLAVVLIMVGFKLTPPSLWRAMWRAGWSQFAPFLVTIVAVVFSDLLTGTLIGLAVGIAFAIRQQQAGALVLVREGNVSLIRVNKDMTFFNKAALKDILAEIANDSHVIVDRRQVDYIDDDIEELLLEFQQSARARGITVEIDLSARDLERRAALAPTHLPAEA